MKFGKICLALFILLMYAPAFAASADAPDGSVVVGRGQSLSSIATQHGVSVRQLVEWNNLGSPDKVRIGQKLLVRPPAEGVKNNTVATAAPVVSPKPAAATPTKSSGKNTSKAGTEPAPYVSPIDVTAPESVPDKVKSDLSGVAHTLVGNASRNIRPNAASKSVLPSADGGFTASYTEVDASTARAEVIPSSEKGKYVGSIRYVEHQYECPGKSKAEALQAQCSKIKSRRMNELIRYEQGKWHY